jgi:hypothetical protein
MERLQKNGELDLKCQPIFPEDIITELGIIEREPMPFEYGMRYYLNGTPY